MLTRLFMVVLLMGSPLYLRAQVAEGILGKWQDSKHPEKQVIMLPQSATAFYGKSLPQPGEAKREETVIFKSLVWDGKAKSYSGVLIDPATKREFPITIKLRNRSTFTFDVKALFFKRQFEFSKIE